MLYGHNRQIDIPAYVRVLRLVPLLFMVLALGFAATQVEDSQFVANSSKAVSAGIGLELVGVSTAHATQHWLAPPGVPYFPDAYVNQSQDREQHIQAF